VGPRAGLYTEAREKNPLPPPGIEKPSPGRPVPYNVLFLNPVVLRLNYNFLFRHVQHQFYHNVVFLYWN
jgi:hypothetical protein